MQPPPEERFERAGMTFLVRRATRDGLRLSTTVRFGEGALDPRVRSAVPIPAPLVVVRRTPSHDKGVRLGMNRALPLGDERFERECFVVCDAPLADVQAALASPTLRDALRSMLALHDGQLTLYGKGLLEWSRARPGVMPSEEDVQKLAASFVIVASELPAFTTSRSPLAATIAEATTVVSILGSLLLCVFALFPIVRWTVFGKELAFASIAAGLVAGVALWPLLVLVHRGRSNGWHALKVCMFFTLLGGVATAVTTGLIVNCGFDDGKPSHRLVDVIRISEHRSKANISYHAEVPSWRAGRTTESVPAGGNTHAKRLRITTKPGRLGAEWLVAVDAAP
jgi:hypothetical protein